MRLEFEPNVTAIPLVENEIFDEVGFHASSDFNALLKKGIAAAQNGERNRARTLLTEASECDPTSEDAWMWLASISDYPEELLAFLKNVLEINPENERAAEWLAATKSLLATTCVQRAVTAHEENSDDLADRCLKQALDYDENCEMAWFWKASLARSEEQKLAFLARVLQANPENEAALNALAAIKDSRSQAILDEAKKAAMAGNRQKAVDLLDEFLQNAPDSVEAWTLKSHLSIAVPEKVEALEKALEIDPDNAAARSGLAFLALTFGRSKDETEPEFYEPVTASGHDETDEANSVANCDVPEPSESEDPEEWSSQPTLETVEFREEPPVEYEMTPRLTTENTFGPEEDIVDADSKTVEDLSPFVQEAMSENVAAEEHDDHRRSEHERVEVDGEPAPAAAVLDYAEVMSAAAEASHSDEIPEEDHPGFSCPFCMSPNEPQAFECKACHATLSVLDIESLLSNPRVDRQGVQQAVTEMEAEWNLREFNEEEFTALGIGHFNLSNPEIGFKYLREASRVNPNNVILASQVNTLAIRLGEMQRQAEARDLMPKGKTILVVDDSPTVRKLISGKLEKSGHNVVCAVDGVDALARLDEIMPDLILLDITMPRMDGYEVCKQIRSKPETRDLPVVMISGKDGFFDKVRGRMAGTTGYVTKPFGPETLMKALETYLLPGNAEVA